jgi:hypothetical protein
MFLKIQMGVGGKCSWANYKAARVNVTVFSMIKNKVYIIIAIVPIN